jgi:glucose/arabinose dehydrogenase
MQRRVQLALLVAMLGTAVFTLNVIGQGKITCDPGNGGIMLPAGFCAVVAADNLGTARHLTVAANGDTYVALQAKPGGVVALRDANGDGKFETKESFGQDSITGIALHNGYLYVAKLNSIERFKMTPGQLKPAGAPEIVVSGLEGERQHGDKGIAFDGKGSLYVNVGAPSNACQVQDRRPKVSGQDPCKLLEKHGGIWKFDENKLGQKQDDGTRYATGLRQMLAITWHDGLYIAMNNRDQLDTFWPDKFTAEDNATRPAEMLLRAEQGSNFGWPYCFYDYGQKKFLLNPEYGGDGKTEGRCASGFTLPVAAFPAHWAPVDLMFYTGNQFPAHYRDGAFIAFHGSWNRSPMPQDGYNVTFQPFTNGKPSGNFEIFANGFAGKSPLMEPNAAVFRADGVAQGPDGSLYIADSQKGRIWHVIYRGAK